MCKPMRMAPLARSGEAEGRCAWLWHDLHRYSPIGRGVYGEIPAVSAIAKKYGKTASQIVLRWNVQHEGSVAIRNR